MHRFIQQLAAQRAAGAGKLDGKQNVAEFAGQRRRSSTATSTSIRRSPTAPTSSPCSAICTAATRCLKAALLQADFFAKLEAWKLDTRKPEPKLVLLGDYIDRGMFSYNGVLRTVMQLFSPRPSTCSCCAATTSTTSSIAAASTAA